MDLSFSQSDDTLECLKQASSSWAGDIEHFVGDLLDDPGIIDSLGREVKINGKPLNRYFDTGKLCVVIGAVKVATALGPEIQDLMQDVMNILCLLALMCGDLIQFFQERGAEKRWQELMSKANMLREKVATTYEKNKQTYDAIYEGLRQLIPPGILFCIQIAATIVAQVWPYHREIAIWIASNWKTIAFGAVVVAAVVGIIAVGVAAFSGSSRRNDKQKRKH